MAILAVIVVCVLILLIFLGQSQKGHSSVIAILIVCCVLVLLIDLVTFFWKFAFIRSIDIEKIPNNKEPPKLMAYEADFEEIAQKEQSYNAHFGQDSKKDSYADRSLMLESKRNSGSERGSNVSKSLTDLVMKRMYRHDGLSDRESKDYPHKKEETIQKK